MTAEQAAKALDRARAAYERRPSDGFAECSLAAAEIRYVRVVSGQRPIHVGPDHVPARGRRE